MTGKSNLTDDMRRIVDVDVTPYAGLWLLVRQEVNAAYDVWQILDEPQRILERRGRSVRHYLQRP